MNGCHMRIVGDDPCKDFRVLLMFNKTWCQATKNLLPPLWSLQGKILYSWMCGLYICSEHWKVFKIWVIPLLVDADASLGEDGFKKPSETISQNKSLFPGVITSWHLGQNYIKVANLEEKICVRKSFIMWLSPVRLCLWLVAQLASLPTELSVTSRGLMPHLQHLATRSVGGTWHLFYKALV